MIWCVCMWEFAATDFGNGFKNTIKRKMQILLTCSCTLKEQEKLIEQKIYITAHNKFNDTDASSKMSQSQQVLSMK